MRDARGNPVSTQSGAALAAAEHALWRMMSFCGTPLDDLAAARAEDPQWLPPPLMPPAAKPSPAARACLAKPDTPLTEHWAARFAAAAHPST